ncbi:PilN domain-containing protein [Rubricoccus marinus]|uniref:Uncharacterized protein n=1 Tax=Rubricoccus marinus TaxID=716817 RepID=A0A259TWC3_9BACT|nr:PilN domain-containing protein [Rubricoccus marinus]OZC01990.1 hypothetical protein BSZ36_02740 [Rubricoccus marinus]
MSDTPLPPNPFEGDPDDTNPFTGGIGDGSSHESTAPGASDFFGGAFSDEDFEPALEAASFAGGADSYFEDAASVEAVSPEAVAEMPVEEGDALVAAPVARPRRRRARKAAGKSSRSRGTQQIVLGINVTPTHVYGVLLKSEGSGNYSALQTLSRVRNQNAEDTSGAMTPSDVGIADLDGAGLDDGSVRFGSGQELDFTGEFDGIATPGDVGIDMGAIGQPRAAAQPIVFELRDMLEELAQSGYDKPALAFGIAPPDVEYFEVLVPADKKAKKAKKSKKGEETAPVTVKRDKLVSLLPPSQPGREIDTDRVAFVPMTKREGRPRYLAIIPQPTDPVVPAISMLREQSKHRRTAFKTIEAEVPLLMGLAALACPSEPHENTAVVRVGAEDTLVLLLSGGELHHMEPMQSVTAYDGPDTICSRVLLQQDVQGVGTVHNVVVLADERQDDLVQGFSAFYPDARVESLGALLGDLGVISPEAPGADEDPKVLGAESVEAAGAALSILGGKNSYFPDANLLPKALRKKKRRMDLTFGWHTLVVGVLLFLSVVFFIGLYFTQASDIAEREQTLAEYPPEATMAVPELQMRIDSLRQAQMEITSALAAMDSLLYGTDRWTQELVRTSRAVSASGGVWFEDWQPNGASVALHGFATSRARVVSLAQRLDAVIEQVTYQDTRGYPVYEFRLDMPSPIELPQTAKYLRAQLGEPVPPALDALAGLDAAAPVAAQAAPPEASGEPAPTTPDNN